VPALLLLALVLRMAAAFAYGVHQNWPASDTFGDTGEYREIAQRLDRMGDMSLIRDGRVYHASRPPLYPLFLAGLLRAFPGDETRTAVILQSLMGALTCYLVYRIAADRFGERAGLIAFFLCAVYPFFIFYTGLFLTETLFVLLYVALNFLLGKTSGRCKPVWAALAGAAMGLGALTRSELLAFPFVALPLWVLTGPYGARLRSALLAACVMGAVIAPWAVRNAGVFDGRIVVGTTRLGHDLYEANNPRADGGIMSERIDWKKVTGLAGADLADRDYEIKSDRILREKALNWISGNPGRFVALIPQKQWRMWRPVSGFHEFQKWHFVVIGIIPYVPIMLLGFYGAWILRGRNTLLPLLIPVMYVALVHCVFLGSMRYRLAAMPFLIILAAVALDRIADAAARR